MLPLLGIALLIVVPTGASLVPGEILTFYVNDDDLNTNHRGIDEVSTAGLLVFTINGIPISGPSKIVETGVNSGVFVGKVNIPLRINGLPLKQGDTLIIKYNDESDASGNPRTTSKSISMSKTNADFSTSSKNIRIGQTFQVRIYDPDFNLDSREPDNISLNLVEFRGTNGIRATLADPVFEAKPKSFRETGDNTNFFVVTIKMPKEIDGKRLKIGSTAELRLTDITSPSNTVETLKTYIRVGLG
jgi:hypothetical protein